MEHHHHHPAPTQIAPAQSHAHHAPAPGNPPHGHAGHDHGAMIADFRRRFRVSLALTAPILLLSEMIQHWLGLHFDFQGRLLVLAALSSVLFFYGGWPFLTGCRDELRQRRPGMMTLIALAITVAYVYSMATVFGFPGMDFFWELATLIVIMLLGHWVEMRAVAGASRALELLVKMLPAEAHVYHGEMLHDMPVSALKPGDRVLVRPGEQVPVDGEVLKGDSFLNEAVLTGESRPVAKTAGDRVIAGALNGNGALEIRVEQTGSGTYLAKVIRLVQEAQNAKSNTQRLADRAAFWLTLVAIVVGVGTLAGWLALGQSWAFAVERMVTVMVISCPHALGLAIPLVVAISTAMAAKNGLLIRNRSAFENARKITTMVFDKTGTLTTGHFGVTRMGSLLEKYSQNDVLRLAAALEQNSEHPIATSIVARAKAENLAIPAAENFVALPGKGVAARVEGREIRVVSPGYVQNEGIAVPETAGGTSAETLVFVLENEKLIGFIALADALRDTSAAAIRDLQRQGIKTLMLTGDNRTVAESVSRQLGLDGFFAEVLPDEKLNKIKELQQAGAFVAMTGDGVNDAPALAQADVGIAVGSGTDVAAETADIILVDSDPRDVAGLIDFGKKTYRKMMQNLWWAAGYNLVTIPLATGFVPGVSISPAAGAVLMSLSTVVVALNAQGLRRHWTKH